MIQKRNITTRIYLRLFVSAFIGCLLFASVVDRFNARTVDVAEVAALQIPTGFSLVGEGEHQLMVLDSNGNVFAAVSSTETATRSALVRWPHNGRPMILDPPPVFPKSRFSSVAIDAVVLTSNNVAYVTVAEFSDGAVLRRFSSVDRWEGGVWKVWRPPPCAARVSRASPEVFAAHGDRVAVSFDPSESNIVNPDDAAQVKASLPRTVILVGAKCVSRFSAITNGVRANYAVGFLGYRDHKPALLSINPMTQQIFAKQLTHGLETDLGEGVPLAINEGGWIVGSTALPGHANESVTGNMLGPAGTYRFTTPHAVVWRPGTKRTLLFNSDIRSVAWDINDANTSVGSVTTKDGVEHAFRATSGKAQLLDELPHTSGWHFSAAYSIRSDGTILGSGTYRGTKVAFLWHLRSDQDVARTSARQLGR